MSSVHAIQYTVPHRGGADGANRTYYDYMHHNAHDDKVLVAKWYAEQRGWSGASGGWIYRTVDGHTPVAVVQGYRTLYSQWISDIRDAVTGHLTGYATFAALLYTEGGYRPTLMFTQKRRDYLYRFLATQYNYCQALRNDPRRAYSPQPTARSA